MKKFQLAHLYRSGRFYGYGISIDGELLANQFIIGIDTNKDDVLPVIKVGLYLDRDVMNNPIDIELTECERDKGIGGVKSYS